MPLSASDIGSGVECTRVLFAFVLVTIQERFWFACRTFETSQSRFYTLYDAVVVDALASRRNVRRSQNVRFQ